jgi:lipid II:glycine glycyltransferase (peptidoglycan interpeptide bridge formation enzyme)
LPFVQRGFDLGTRYTYLIDDLSDLDAVWQSVSSSRRRRIKAAQKKLEVRETDDLDLFLRLQRMTFARQGERPSGSDDQIRRIDEACRRHNARRILIAVDEAGNVHSGEYLVYDEDTTFDLMSGTDPQYRSSDAGSLLVWEAIKRAATTSKSLNFSGGSLVGVEPFVASFGARQQPYLTISRASLRWQTLNLGRNYLRTGRRQLRRAA